MFESHAELIDSDMSVSNEVGDNVETSATRNINIVVYFMLYFGVVEPAVQVSCQEYFKNI